MKYDLGSRNIHIFLEEHQIKNELGLKLEFQDHAFLWDIYQDMSPNQVILKAPQIGMTVLEIIKSLWVAYYKKKDIIYTLPSQSDVTDMAGGKVNRLLAQNPIFLQWTKDHDSVEQKSVGDNIIYYRGTWTSKQAMMVSSGLNIHDEVDASKQEVVQQYETRLQARKDGWRWYFSHPSVPGVGVAKYWAISDQKHWFVKCGCGYEQILNWPESIDVERQVYQCKECKQELTDDQRRHGRWVKKYKDREFSGYWVSQLICPWISAKKVILDFETKPQDYFYNYVLGLPYAGSDNTVTAGSIYQNCKANVATDSVIIGCDSGIKKHYVVGNRKGLISYGVTEDWEDIARLLVKFPRGIAVIDAMPDITAPRQLRERFRGRVFLCHYAKDRKTMQLIRWGENEEYGNVVADRNRLMQTVIDDFANTNLALNGKPEDWDAYYKHWATLYKVTETNALGVPEFSWESSNGEDHWCHATCYYQIGRERFGRGGGKILEEAILKLPPDLVAGHDGVVRAPAMKVNLEKEYDWRD